MHHLKASSWIFVALVLLLALVMIHPSATMIWLCILGLHVLIVAQVAVVLMANEQSEHTFAEKWYDDDLEKDHAGR